MVKISNASYENEIHKVDRPFQQRFQKYKFFVKEALISGEGQLEILGKMAKTKPIFMQIREW